MHLCDDLGLGLLSDRHLGLLVNGLLERPLFLDTSKLPFCLLERSAFLRGEVGEEWLLLLGVEVEVERTDDAGRN